MTEEDQKLDLALAQHRSGNLAEAAALYQQVLQINPKKADALYLLGCLALQTANEATAVQLLRKATVAAPRQAEYHHALGLALTATRDFAEAAEHYRQATQLAPKHVAALSGLADSLLELGSAAEAAQTYRLLLTRAPSAKAWYGCGCADNLLGEFAAAKDCFTQALKLQPDWLEARHNLGRAWYELGMVDQAYVAFQECSKMMQPGAEQSRSMMAVIVPGVPATGNREILEVRESWWQGMPRVITSPGGFRKHAPLRVGYVSSFFQRDNWMKPVWGLINQHDRNRIKVHLFSDCAADQIKYGYKARADDHYLDTSSLTNADIARLVTTCGIDVLVDLNGFSNMRRLPMLAEMNGPVVMGWFNMYATSGSDRINFLIGDSEVVPPNEAVFYSEKILRVNGSYLTFDVCYPVPPVTIDRQIKVKNFVFGSLASAYKITDEVVTAWCRLLRNCPDTLLLIKNKQLQSAAARKFLTARFEERGVSGSRLQLEGPEAHFEFLGAYSRMDLALDTFPYNGGTTTSEAIWQGVPVLAFYGDRWAARTSASILRAAGLGEFVAEDVNSYVELGCKLATSKNTLDELRQLRIDMRSRLSQSSICDTAGFAKQMEALYETAV